MCATMSDMFLNPRDPRAFQRGGPIGHLYPGYHQPAQVQVVGRPPAQVVGAHGMACPPANALGPEAVNRIVHGAPALSPMAQQGVVAGAAALVAGAREIEAQSTKEWFGIDSGAAALIAAGAVVNVTVSPQRNVVPERLWCSDLVANTFSVRRIVCGADEILAATVGIPMSVFRSDALSPYFRGYAMTVGMDFTVEVENAGGAPARFQAAISGKGFRYLA